jgi:hypothetical protein
MAFAIFYEHSDLAAVVANASPFVLSGGDRVIANKVWNGGLKNWQTAPYGQSPFEEPGASPLARVIVIDSSVTLAEFRALLYRIAGRLGATPDVQYVRALADDMGGTSGAVEPWPVV